MDAYVASRGGCADSGCVGRLRSGRAANVEIRKSAEGLHAAITLAYGKYATNALIIVADAYNNLKNQ